MNLFDVGVFEEKTLRKMYQRERDNVFRNVRRIKQAGYQNNQAVARAEKYLKPSSQLSFSELQKAYIDLQNIRKMKTSTLGGQHKADKKTMESLQRNGYDFVNNGNIQSFGLYMDWLKEIGELNTIYSKKYKAAAESAKSSPGKSAYNDEVFKHSFEDWQRYSGDPNMYYDAGQHEWTYIGR